MKWIKKPIPVEAFKYNIDSRPDWFQDEVTKNNIITYPDDSCYIKTLEGDMKATKGDYIIKGIRGEIYPCKADIFEASYNKKVDEIESDFLP